ncbi:MAG: hypothetical protein ACM34A_09345 [Bacillota bacterium]
MNTRFRLERLLPPALRARQDERRRLHYIDHIIQKWLLVALVVLECALVGLAMWALYRSLGEIIDDNLYRVHLSDDMKVLPRFLAEGVRILLAVGAVNLLAIVLADRIWAVYVHGIIRRMDGIMHRARELDFSENYAVHHAHAVLEQAVSWRRAEAERLGRVRREVAALPATVPPLAQGRAAAQAALERIREHARSHVG